jgi:hypothetical protein
MGMLLTWDGTNSLSRLAFAANKKFRKPGQNLGRFVANSPQV